MINIDFKKQAEEIGIDEDSLISLYDLFFEQTQKDMLNLKTSISEKNVKDVQVASHHIKGACLNLEINNLVEIARSIEDHSSEENWENIEILFNEFQNNIIQLKVLLTGSNHE